LSPQLIQAAVPDYHECQFYLSGPNSMVNSFTGLLRQMGVPDAHIKTDLFPGFA